MSADLERFVAAQNGIYHEALAELVAGEKRSHWMWFVFPQIAGLGRSPAARFYAIANLAEARTYLTHPLLGPRLVQSCEAVLRWAGRRDAEAIFGELDALKFRSSLTLFEQVGLHDAGQELSFARAIDAFFGGIRDTQTIAIVGADPGAG